jgi:hypothetical protein
MHQEVMMAKFCYHCGETVHEGMYCKRCGTTTAPPNDVYFTEEDCGDCDTPLPRWANFCPKCGRKFGFTAPIEPQKAAKRNKGLVAGAVFFSIVATVIALVLSLAEEAIPVKYALLGAAVFIMIIWVITIIRWERGKYKDGTVIRHYSEDRIRTTRDINIPTYSGRGKRVEIPYTLYSTEVRFDDGTDDIFNLECQANHIQLNIGDRVRYYLSARTYRKL